MPKQKARPRSKRASCTSTSTRNPDNHGPASEPSASFLSHSAQSLRVRIWAPDVAGRLATSPQAREWARWRPGCGHRRHPRARHQAPPVPHEPPRPTPWLPAVCT